MQAHGAVSLCIGYTESQPTWAGIQTTDKARNRKNADRKNEIGWHFCLLRQLRLQISVTYVCVCAFICSLASLSCRLFQSALVNKNWTEQVPKPRIKRSAITPQDAILDRTLRNDIQGTPTARNSSADKTIPPPDYQFYRFSGTRQGRAAFSGGCVAGSAAGFLRFRIYQQFKAGAKRCNRSIIPRADDSV